MTEFDEFPDTEWRANANERGSQLYDYSHQLEQFDRERKAWVWAWTACAVILAVSLTVICYVWP